MDNLIEKHWRYLIKKNKRNKKTIICTINFNFIKDMIEENLHIRKLLKNKFIEKEIFFRYHKQLTKMRDKKERRIHDKTKTNKFVQDLENLK